MSAPGGGEHDALNELLAPGVSTEGGKTTAKRPKDAAQHEMICVNCGSSVQHVYREFSKGNIRLTKCVRSTRGVLCAVGLSLGKVREFYTLRALAVVLLLHN